MGPLSLTSVCIGRWGFFFTTSATWEALEPCWFSPYYWVFLSTLLPLLAHEDSWLFVGFFEHQHQFLRNHYVFIEYLLDVKIVLGNGVMMVNIGSQ